MRYEKKLEKEVFSNAVMRYIKDPKKNIRRLFEYAEIFNITKKMQSQIGKVAMMSHSSASILARQKIRQKKKALLFSSC